MCQAPNTGSAVLRISISPLTGFTLLSSNIETQVEMLQGVPYYWARFVFVIFSGSRAHTEELS